MSNYDGVRQEFFTNGEEAAVAAGGILVDLVALLWTLFVTVPRAMFRSR